MDKQIEFTPELLEKLKEAYGLAIKNGKPLFIFNGSEWVTDYAKYVIEYLNNKFYGK